MSPSRIDRPTADVQPRGIQSFIQLVRGQRVILDSDLAQLYGVQVRALNQAVSRNLARFPADFAFRLTSAEVSNLRSQIVTSSRHGSARYAPRAFTEQGVATLSSVLRSRRAIDVNVAIMRVFVQLREMLASHADLARRIDELEDRFDGQFAEVFDAIRALTAPTASEKPRPCIGFTAEPRSSGQSAGESLRSSAGRTRRR